MSLLDRRQFGTLSAAALAASLTRNLWATEAHASSQHLHVALLADTHIIDSFYVKGSENGVEDNESILHTTERMSSARGLINSLNHPAIERTFIVGDFFHNYPSTDYDFYFKNTTRLDNAFELAKGFRAPVHIGFGNHDYDVRHVDRAMSHRLFKEKFNTEPYYAVEDRGIVFLHLNNFLGSTQDRTSPDFNPSIGSLGKEQLDWAEAKLRERKPTFVFVHYPLFMIADREYADFGLQQLMRKYKDNIRLVVSGHVHKWMDLAHTYGPQHYTMGSTRYDQNAYMLLQIDQHSGEWRFLNADLVEWATHYSRPYQQS